MLFDPPPGEYKLHVVNYDQVMNSPDDWFDGRVTFRVADAARRDGHQGELTSTAPTGRRPTPGNPP